MNTGWYPGVVVDLFKKNSARGNTVLVIRFLVNGKQLDMFVATHTVPGKKRLKDIVNEFGTGKLIGENCSVFVVRHRKTGKNTITRTRREG